MEGILAAIVLICGLITRGGFRRCRDDEKTFARVHAGAGSIDDEDCSVDLMTAERQRPKVKITRTAYYKKKIIMRSQLMKLK